MRIQAGLQEMLGIAEAMLASPLPEVVGYFREAFQRYSMLIAGSTEPRRAVHLATRAMMLAAVHSQQHRSFHEAHVCLMRAQLQVASGRCWTGVSGICSSVCPLHPGLQHPLASLQDPTQPRLGPFCSCFCMQRSPADSPAVFSPMKACWLCSTRLQRMCMLGTCTAAVFQHAVRGQPWILADIRC